MAQERIRRMKLVQLNIWQGRFLDQIVAFLEREQPDILCMQEVYSSKLDTPLLPFFAGLEHVQKAFPEYHVFFSPTHQMDVMGEAVAMGNAILSKFPLENTETIFINGEFHELTVSNSHGTNTRNLQRAEVVIAPDKRLSIVNHHGYWEPSPIGSEITIQKMQHVADILKETPQPLIFTGDLNISYASPAIKPVQELLKGLSQEYEVATTLSQFGKVAGVPCDHIFISADIIEQSFMVKDVLVSDHLPLILQFELA
jgi:endonuclease/exonuclease/phosphatase family metal-dependent hydrolase